MAKLTDEHHRDVPFELCFKYPLENGYTFKEMTPENNKQFQKFLNKVSKMTVTEVDKALLRKPDISDTFMGRQVYHYKVDSTFRIHVVIEEGSFKVIRLDPKHKFHKE